MAPEKPSVCTMYADLDCAACRIEVDVLKPRWGEGVEVCPIAQAPKPDDAPDTWGRRTTLLHVRTADGVWLTGVDALALLYRWAGWGALARALTHPLVKPMAQWCYRVLMWHKRRQA